MFRGFPHLGQKVPAGFILLVNFLVVSVNTLPSSSPWNAASDSDQRGSFTSDYEPEDNDTDVDYGAATSTEFGRLESGEAADPAGCQDLRLTARLGQQLLRVSPTLHYRSLRILGFLEDEVNNTVRRSSTTKPGQVSFIIPVIR